MADTVLDAREVNAAADALFDAERNRAQIGILSERFPQMGMADAYAIQTAFVARKTDGGAKPIGYKIGLTSKAMQQALGIDIPDSGVLLDDMRFANGGQVPAGHFIEPRVEAEIAFLMASDVGGAAVTRDDIIAATEAVAPALEILDTRQLRRNPETGAIRKVYDTIADNAANAGIVLGDQRVALGDADLRWMGAIVSRDGNVEETGLGAGVLGDPVESIVWLARRLAENGDTIRAGDIVLSGSFIRPIECPPGAVIEADYGQFGVVAITFD